MSKRVARWAATCRGRHARVARVRAVSKPYTGPSLRWRGCLAPFRWTKCPGLPTAFGNALRNAARAIASPEITYDYI